MRVFDDHRMTDELLCTIWDHIDSYPDHVICYDFVSMRFGCLDCDGWFHKGTVHDEDWDYAHLIDRACNYDDQPSSKSTRLECITGKQFMEIVHDRKMVIPGLQ